MIQDGGTPGDKKNKSHDLQKRITGLEHELELRFVLTDANLVCGRRFNIHLSAYDAYSSDDEIKET